MILKWPLETNRVDIEKEQSDQGLHYSSLCHDFEKKHYKVWLFRIISYTWGWLIKCICSIYALALYTVQFTICPCHVGQRQSNISIWLKCTLQYIQTLNVQVHWILFLNTIQYLIWTLIGHYILYCTHYKHVVLAEYLSLFYLDTIYCTVLDMNSNWTLSTVQYTLWTCRVGWIP